MVVKSGRSTTSSRLNRTPSKSPITASRERSRPSRTYSSSKSGESGSGRFSTTCRRHQAERGNGGSHRTLCRGSGGR